MSKNSIKVKLNIQCGITQTNYNLLKKYINEKLNKDKTSFKTTNDEPTPVECAEEMLGYIPVEFWEKNDISILDPCSGYGNLLVPVYNYLKQNHTDKDILENILHFNEINTQRIDILKKIFEYKTFNLNITNLDFLKFNNDIKYDLQIVNPPYAKFNEIIDSNGIKRMKRASKNHTLVRDFIQKSLDICKDGGYIIYIVPNNWMSLADRNKIIKDLTQYQFIHLDIAACKKYFPKIGSSFTYFIIKKIPFYKDFTVKCLYNKKNYTSMVKSQKRDFIPLLYSNMVQSILNKVLNSANEKLLIETTSDLHKYTKKHLINKNCDETFKYRLIHTDKQTVYASRAHKYQMGWKVFLSTTGKWNIFIDNDCGMTQSIAFVRVGNKEEATKIKKILDHNLYRFINNICRWGNFNCIRILQRMPKPQNIDDIYSSFDITDDERTFIEDNV